MREHTGATFNMIILARDATVFSCQCRPFLIKVYIQNIMMKYGIPETEITLAGAI
jgi:hypothetical protein